MTPTEQDKELRKAVWASLASQITHAINCTDLEHDEQDSCEDFTKENFEQLMQLITADRKRVELEARIDEITDATDMDGRNTVYVMVWRNGIGYPVHRDERIAELKAQQEEK